MKKGMIVLLGVFGVIAVMAMWAISVNNSLVRKDEGVKAAWSQVENVYQRRMDLIPNLVATVKGYASHEKETLQNVTKARNQAAQITGEVAAQAASDPAKLQAFQKAQDALGSALSRLLITVERYPDLKANQNFRDLQVQLEGTENRIAVERRRFNEVAQDYNSSVRAFPTSVIAGMRGFAPRAYFEAAQGAATAPKVEF